jgi:hypothetical protein
MLSRSFSFTFLGCPIAEGFDKVHGFFNFGVGIRKIQLEFGFLSFFLHRKEQK